MSGKIKQADTILHNGTIYTVDAHFSVQQAVAITNGGISAVGSNQYILQNYQSANTVNLRGAYVYPGFNDAHCHLLRYARQLGEVQLFGLTSWQAVVQQLQQYHRQNPHLTAIIGRGWDQNLWNPAVMPDKTDLDTFFPDIPVLLTRIDLHAAVANAAALQLAGITHETNIDGGIVHLNRHAETSGLLIDNAVYFAEQHFPPISQQQFEQLMLAAQQHCHAVGLTSLTDALVMQPDWKVLFTLQNKVLLKIKINALILGTDENLEHYFELGKQKTPYLNAGCFKFFADGALGSRGAWLLEPYTDEPATSGLQLLKETDFVKKLKAIYQHGFQVATHAIGDAANQFVLEAYRQVLPPQNTLRWRLEHAQIVHPNNLEIIKQYNIIPSVQPIHATSDMYWVKNRLGNRINHAYNYKTLLQTAGLVASGSDFPVEPINPLLGFYAAVSRKDVSGFPENGFRVHEALTRIQALKSMTIWAAYASFEEQEKGSIEPGKMADLTILDTDLLLHSIGNIPKAKVLGTMVNGGMVYNAGLD